MTDEQLEQLEEVKVSLYELAEWVNGIISEEELSRLTSRLEEDEHQEAQDVDAEAEEDLGFFDYTPGGSPNLPGAGFDARAVFERASKEAEPFA